MKKILLSALMLFVASCATVKPQHPNLTVKNVTKNCDATEKWSMSVMGVGTIVAIYDDCFSYEKLLMIPVQKLDGHKAIIQVLTAELTKNHFLYFMHEREEYIGKYKWHTEKIKTELEENWTAFYYKLIQEKIENKD